MEKRKMSFTNKVIERNGRLGADTVDILTYALQAVDPYTCVSRHIKLQGQTLIIGKTSLSLQQFERVFLIGFGKASVPMAKALMDELGSVLSKAWVITKDPKFLSENGYLRKLTVYVGGHPVPTQESIQATKTVINSLPALTDKDLVLVVISGGGSALFTDPVPGVSLEDLQQLTQLLLDCGAKISEINTIRKHLDWVKGGALAMRLQPAHIETFILSDVIGDRLNMIASGPTVEDTSTFQDALKIISKHNLKGQVPAGILRHLEHERDGTLPGTVKPRQFPVDKVRNHLMGTNFLAAEAAYHRAQSLGYHAVIITTALTGRTKHIADFIEGIYATQSAYGHPIAKPACIIFGGEPTVHVIGEGVGGRNMHLALRMVPKLAGKAGAVFVSLATDGEDGPTDAAGAIVDGLVFKEGKQKFGLDLEAHIRNNDAYHYHAKVGGLIKTGATGTNVNDLMLLLIE
ncbi:MAG: glycerate kinase type-2 family protein [Brevefilum sp.]